MAQIKLQVSGIYTINGIDREVDVDSVQEIIVTLIENAVGSGLNLNNLTNIHFPQNFSDSLHQFQREKGLNEGYTDNERLSGYGMAMSYLDENQEIKYAIFFRLEVLLALLTLTYETDELTEKDQNQILSLFFHELFHISDFNYIDELIREENFDKDEFDTFYSTWSEYYAHRSTELNFPSQTINDIQSNVIEYFNLLSIAITSNDRNQVLEKLSLLTRYMGEAHSKSTDLQSLVPGSSKNFLLLEIEKQLKVLFDLYPDWTREDFDKLTADVNDLCSFI